jgi:hypothetical protein
MDFYFPQNPGLFQWRTVQPILPQVRRTRFRAAAAFWFSLTERYLWAAALALPAKLLEKSVLIPR